MPTIAQTASPAGRERRIDTSVLERIANTPLLELRRIVPDGCARILIKVESVNPTGSMKDRMALAMIEAGERTGRLKPGDQLPTEQALATTFGVSRNVVREAIARLRSEGRIWSQQGRGAFVTHASNPTVLAIDYETLQSADSFRSLFELLDVAVGQFLDLVESPALLVFTDQFIFEQLFALIVGVAADITKRNAVIFGDMMELLHEFAAALLGKLRDGHADDLAVVAGVEAEIGVADCFLDGSDLG